ncbi:MAG: coproporphyrinogen dehydrogenase HemZ, partial [Oscillospiraceae bacterium]
TPQSFSLYVSIPFCPSRCSYCSFVSEAIATPKAKALLSPYVDKLCEEIKAAAKISRELGLRLETVYFGGGTPTTLSATQLKQLCDTIAVSFDMSTVREYTVEAGRPDTIDEDKLMVLKYAGVTRISINPQSLSDDVLKLIGRNHTAQDIADCFKLARRLGFNNINMDLIAGLEGDTLESFEKTVEYLLKLSPENITVHTLSVKRAAKIVKNKEQLLTQDSVAEQMVSYAGKRLSESGYKPYYLYRQKNTLSNLENTGYSKPGFEGLYNVFIMDEIQTVLAVGAGAVTKLCSQEQSKVQRIYNFKFPFEYLRNFDEILIRQQGIKDFYANVNQNNTGRII